MEAEADDCIPSGEPDPAAHDAGADPAASSRPSKRARLETEGEIEIAAAFKQFVEPLASCCRSAYPRRCPCRSDCLGAICRSECPRRCRSETAKRSRRRPPHACYLEARPIATCYLSSADPSNQTPTNPQCRLAPCLDLPILVLSGVGGAEVVCTGSLGRGCWM